MKHVGHIALANAIAALNNALAGMKGTDTRNRKNLIHDVNPC